MTVVSQAYGVNPSHVAVEERQQFRAQFKDPQLRESVHQSTGTSVDTFDSKNPTVMRLVLHVSTSVATLHIICASIGTSYVYLLICL